MKTCLEAGTLQSYLDGELSPNAMQSVATHLASCRACAALAREAEAELAVFMEAMAPAASIPASVPTARLRERLDAALAEAAGQHDKRPAARGESSWRGWLAGLAAFLTPAPGRAAAFASLLVAVLLSVLFVSQRLAPGEIKPSEVAVVPVSSRADNVPSTNGGAPDATVDSTTVATTPASDAGLSKATPRKRGDRDAVNQLASYPSRPRRSGGGVSQSPPGGEVTGVAGRPVLLPGEKTYLSAIASLTSTIESRTPQAMPPSLRVEYERHLALVDQAILSTRVAARRNPRDTDAQDFLRSAYQNKVELLSAVAEQSQLATIKD